MTDAAETAAREQAALRPVATRLAEGTTADELFSVVAKEVARVLGASAATLDRFEPDGGTLTLAVAHAPDWEAACSVAYPGRRWPREPGTLADLVYERRRAARIDDYAAAFGVSSARRCGQTGSGRAARPRSSSTAACGA